MKQFYLSALLALSSGCSFVEGDGGFERLWRTEAPSEPITDDVAAADDERYYTLTAPADAAGLRLAAFDAATGERAWSRRPEHFCFAVVAAAGRVFCPNDAVQAYDAATGEPLWSHREADSFTQVEGTADADRLFAGTFDVDARRSELLAFDAATGEVLWRRDVSGLGPFGAWTRALALDGDVLFASVDAYHGEFNLFLSASVILAFDAATGRELWRFQDGDGSDSRKIGSLAVTPDVLVYSDPDGGQQVLAVDRTSRDVRWRVPRRPGFLGTRNGPAIADGIAYIAEGDERLRAIDVASGRVLWDVRPDRGSYTNHAVCGRFFVGENTALTVVERETGARVAVLFAGSETVTQLATHGERLFVTTTEAAYAFDCR